MYDSHKGTKEIAYSFITPKNRSGIKIFGFLPITKIKHKDRTITQLEIAKIIEYKEENGINFDDVDYIAFEISDVFEIDKEVAKSIIDSYKSQKNDKDKKECVYIGRLTQNALKYEFSKKNRNVEEYVKNNISEKIRRKKNVEKKEKEEKTINEKVEFNQRVIVSSELMKTNTEKRERRKHNPTLVLNNRYQAQNGKIYENYDGINIETGDILKIRNLDKVGKDGSGTNLYSANLSCALNYNDEYFSENIQNGTNICFELERSFEDIVRENNPEMIKRLLELLSASKNFYNKEVLNYIGGIDKNGKIQRNEKSLSPAIQATIEEMKMRFENELKNLYTSQR